MPGQIDICNRSLSIVGTRSTIASLTESSAEAIQCSIHYTAVLNGLLRLHTWSFARKQVSGAMICAAAGTPENPTGTPPLPLYPWNYEYAWPQDCVRFRRIEMPPPTQSATGTNLVWTGNYPPLNNGYPGMPDGGGAHRTPPFAISTDQDSAGNTIKVILTNQDQAIFVYTAAVSDPNMWDAEFTEAFVYILAARLCGPLTGDKNLTKIYLQEAQNAILQARLVDATESPAKPEHTPDWIRARGFAGMEDALFAEYDFMNLAGMP
jgi:hypothetical protein